jgi:hypothetical protein
MTHLNSILLLYHKLNQVIRKIRISVNGDSLKIHLYTICWNEEYMLRFFFMHYDDIVDKYIVFDDGSTDSTLDILKNHPKVEIRALPRVKQDSYVLAAQNLHNSCWKESRHRADWIIITAIDELLYHPDLKAYIRNCEKKGITIIPALGYQMISETLPDPGQKITDSIKKGAPDNAMSKLILFKPGAIKETNYEVGRHKARPTGKVKYPESDELLNLHYKYLSFEYTVQRHQELDNKRGLLDKEKGWGIHYQWSRDELKNKWDLVNTQAVEDVLSPEYNASAMHSGISERWWRKGSSGKYKAG